MFVVDVREGITALDEMVAEKLRRHGRDVLVVANKADSVEEEVNAYEFARLGLGEVFPVSAEHGRGISDLTAVIREKLGAVAPVDSEMEAETRRIRISLIGRPNVGKSSLGNRLLDSKRLIVSDVPGTTRDSVELDLDYEHRDGELLKFRLADTAGLRSKSKVDSPVEFFSSVRSQQAMERSDVVFLVIDAITGVTKQDQAIAGAVMDAGRALVVIVNKWDLIIQQWEQEPVEGFRSLKHFLESYERSWRKEMFFLPDPPVLFVSAETGFRIESMLEAAAAVSATLDMKIPTGKLNGLIQSLFEARAPKLVGIKRFKVFYAVQIGSRPMQIRLFCNRIERLDPAYRRYLERAIIHEFHLSGCPVRFDLVGKERRYQEGETSMEYVPRQSDEQQREARIRKMGENAVELDRKHPEKRPKIIQEKAAHNLKKKRS